MTHQLPPELRVSERPIRSDYARSRSPSSAGREKSYARRRVATLIVLAIIVSGVLYAFLGHRPVNPADIPTIKAEEGIYKQKPVNPGGIDIPHQDVQVYDQLEDKNGAPAEVEHLLPQPEQPIAEPPKTLAHQDALPVAVAPVAIAPIPATAPAPTPVPTPVPVAPVTAAPAPQKTVSIDAIIPPQPKKITNTTVAVAPVAPPAQSVSPQSLSIDQVIANTKSAALPTSPKPLPSNGNSAIQLASANDHAKAQSMMADLQNKYAPQLGGAVLQLTRADLGSRGIFYRIQSQPMAESDAAAICASLKKINAGCILVRK